MASPLFCDVFMTERLLLSFVDLKIILNRNIDAFCVMSYVANLDQKVKLTDTYLKLRKVKVSPNVSVVHELALKKGPAIYPIRRVECESFIVPAGNPSLRKDNIFNGLVPKSFVFGLVDSAAFNGTTPKIPSTSNISTCLRLRSPSTEKICRSNLYNFPTVTIPNTSKRTPPCFPARERCITT